ncbi:serine/threonine protein kinase [Pseudenhygromyxa sp. WMMC2535]|uniref:serine/threonine-protein kinase n=1 Tax=Pseudenhygromyxa sp. WMMC2535 TaxID=2712867 RepID=UPI001553C2C6|nr:serine/threonine-protein kinase [Pseudenhygromyxa sp. WMMC2535]NVB40680.1 serine/threonine protein kinase [Pseudenhygromyxa sp. WMMC2535]
MPAPPQPPPRDPMLGAILLARYRILGRLGKGGMGSVYLAEHVAIHKRVAIKVLSPELAKKPEFVQRFLREARAASIIRQENVVEISDFGEAPGGTVFFAMELLEGEDLRDMIRREGLQPWPRVRHFMLQICRALEAAHAAGIIHRDMKPDNCFRITRGRDADFIKVLDFGIAKIDDGTDGKGLTRTGMIVGTPSYIAPEQVRSSTIDHRADIYSSGVILFALLVGRPPFKGVNMMETMKLHLFEAPKAPSAVAPGAGIPPELDAIVLKCMQKDPNLRFGSMAEMIAALESVGTGARAVQVVSEDLSLPAASSSQFEWRGGAAGSTPAGAMPAGSSQPGWQSATGSMSAGAQSGITPVAAPVRHNSTRTVMWVGLAGMFVSGLIALGLFLFLGGDDDEAGGAEAGDAASEVARADPPAAGEGEGGGAVALPKADSQAGVELVELELSANVSALVLDAEDGARYGVTNDAEAPLSFERSDDPIELVLRAEGYEDLSIKIVPNRAKSYEYELIPLAGASKKATKKTPASSGQAKPETAEPAPAPTDESEDKAHEELKNPFSRP